MTHLKSLVGIATFALSTFFSTCLYSTAPSQLSFDEAYQHLLEHSLRLKVADSEINVKQAERVQARVRPNPIFSVTADNVGQSRYWDNNELTFALSQLFELGGKRRARVRVSTAAEISTQWNLEILKCDLYTELTHAFITVAIAQENLAVAHEQQVLAEQAHVCTLDKLQQGKCSAIDQKRSEINVRAARLFHSKRYLEFTQAKKSLSALWDCSPLFFESVLFPLFEVVPPPSLDALEQELNNNPQLFQAHAEIIKAWEIISLEKSERIPDLSVEVGVSADRDSSATFTFGISIPLPIFNRNDGNICRAKHEYNQAIMKQEYMVCNLKNQLFVMYEEWQMAYDQVMTLQALILPLAHESHELAKESYETGKFEYLVSLDARNTFYTIRQQYIDALALYHHKRADIMRLVVQSCSEVLR